MPKSSFLAAHEEPDAGFSVIEALIASAVLLIIVVGLLPMFMRALSNNVQGQQLTGLVHRAVADMEEVAQLGWDDELFVLGSGDSFGDPPQAGRETEQLFSELEQEWIDEGSFPAGDRALFRRVIRVRNYLTTTFENGSSTGDWTAAEVADVDFDLREVQVVVTANETNTVFGPPRQLTLRFFKAF